MNLSEFLDFIKKLPMANIPVNGLNGWLLQSNDGQLLFNESEVETTIPEHSHGDRWDIVIDGTIELTVDEKTNKYNRGDACFIAGGSVHSTRIHPGFRAIDYFTDKDRYKAL